MHFPTPFSISFSAAVDVSKIAKITLMFVIVIPKSKQRNAGIFCNYIFVAESR